MPTSEMLDSKHQEQRHGAGGLGGQSVVELYVSDKGTFTVLVTNAKGMSCIAMGQGWEKEKIKAKEEKAL